MVQNFSVYNETQPEPLKAIVIVIDQYEVIKELGESNRKLYTESVKRWCRTWHLPGS